MTPPIIYILLLLSSNFSICVPRKSIECSIQIIRLVVLSCWYRFNLFCSDSIQGPCTFMVISIVVFGLLIQFYRSWQSSWYSKRSSHECIAFQPRNKPTCMWLLSSSWISSQSLSQVIILGLNDFIVSKSSLHVQCVGSAGTGKSTLGLAMAKQFSIPWSIHPPPPSQQMCHRLFYSSKIIVMFDWIISNQNGRNGRKLIEPCLKRCP